MIRRPPRSAPLSLHDALPISCRRGAVALPGLIRFGDRPSGRFPAACGKRMMRPSEFGLGTRSEEHTSELQSRQYLVCRLLLEKKHDSRNTRTWFFLFVPPRAL